MLINISRDVMEPAESCFRRMQIL